MPDGLIHLTPDTTTHTDIQPIDRLIGEVAAYLGGEHDPLARSKAVSFLDRAADRLNAFGTFLFTRKEVVYTDISAGDTTVPIPSDFGWPVDPALTRKTSGIRTGGMTWPSYNTFRQVIATRDSSKVANRGTPRHITYKSEYDDNFEFWPPADMEEFDEMVVNYLAPVSRPSEVADQESVWLLAPVREVMLMGGIALMMQFRHRAQPNIWLPFMNDFERWLSKARASAYRRQQVEHAVATPGESPHVSSGLRSRMLFIVGGN